jgi:hypothetical protein
MSNPTTPGSAPEPTAEQIAACLKEVRFALNNTRCDPDECMARILATRDARLAHMEARLGEVEGDLSALATIRRTLDLMGLPPRPDRAAEAQRVDARLFAADRDRFAAVAVQWREAIGEVQEERDAAVARAESALTPEAQRKLVDEVKRSLASAPPPFGAWPLTTQPDPFPVYAPPQLTEADVRRIVIEELDARKPGPLDVSAEDVRRWLPRGLP